MDIKSYLNYLTEQRSNNYIYHYTPKDNYKLINKHGLLSLYGLYIKEPAIFNKTIENYIPRIKKQYKKDNIEFSDIEKFFKEKNLSLKSIFFSFWEIIPGLSKERDEFVTDSIKILIDINNLKSNWKYSLISGPKVENIKIKDILKYSKIDSIEFQKKPGGKFYFSNIPHLAIETNDGIIKRNLIQIIK